jgi:dihydrolipoamide dehydrogenase
VIIATGATTRLLPGHVAVRAGGHLRGADPRRGSCPSSVVIAGAGAIGVEFAYVLKNYGVDVTIVEFLDRMVPLRTRRSPRSSPSTTRSSASKC